MAAIYIQTILKEYRNMGGYDLKTGDTVKVIAGPAAGASGIVTRISNGNALVINLYKGTRYSANIEDLKKINQPTIPKGKE